ncbi:hypothetical protein [Planomonospora venezuelensis]|uniref:Uncharacterized protein n=2 Tax=Planomonospora venezuelensis TaxID=1999 RepID=A0A841CSC5_PLAVE|nr:hypothetical protein [Planomonospora venezuelensis]MBB5961342.1 hypothetical protein [Planomonospora venezuelensis]GIN01916.1 hypothetical protein Pve01_35740 [Planomonospora venezuelensis]
MPPPEPRLPLLTRALIGPPGLLLLPVCALTGLLLLYGVSVPGGYFGLLLLGGFAGLLLTVVWLPRFVVGLIREDGRPGLRRHWVRWAAAPVMAAAVIGLVAFDVPWTVRFAASEASLERVAKDVSAGAEPEGGTRWIGLVQVSSVTRADGGVAFRLADAGFLDSHGLVWSPEGAPQENAPSTYEHLDGPWYEWTEGW